MFKINAKYLPLLMACAVAALSGTLTGCSRDAYAESPLILSPRQALVSEALQARPVPFNREDHHRNQRGQLIYLGGLELQSGDRRFGGLSALRISPDGSRMLAISDRGYWIGATLDYQNGRLTGARDLMIAPLLDLAGQPLNKSKTWGADAEGLTELPGSGPDSGPDSGPNSGLVVSFEGQHRLWRYAANFDDFMLQKAARPWPLPADTAQALAALPANGGLESLTTLTDGSLLAIAEEGGDRNGTNPAWIIGANRVAAFRYQTSDNFRPTDLATLPNGDVLVLERRLTLLQGLAARVKRIAAADLATSAKSGGTVTARLVAFLSYPDMVDNMEGIAVRQGPAGEIYVYLVSDDNYHPLQRTLLMMFRLAD